MRRCKSPRSLEWSRDSRETLWSGGGDTSEVRWGGPPYLHSEDGPSCLKRDGQPSHCCVAHRQKELKQGPVGRF